VAASPPSSWRWSSINLKFSSPEAVADQRNQDHIDSDN